MTGDKISEKGRGDELNYFLKLVSNSLYQTLTTKYL